MTLRLHISNWAGLSKSFLEPYAGKTFEIDDRFETLERDWKNVHDYLDTATGVGMQLASGRLSRMEQILLSVAPLYRPEFYETQLERLDAPINIEGNLPIRLVCCVSSHYDTKETLEEGIKFILDFDRSYGQGLVDITSLMGQRRVKEKKGVHKLFDTLRVTKQPPQPSLSVGNENLGVYWILPEATQKFRDLMGQLYHVNEQGDTFCNDAALYNFQRRTLGEVLRSYGVKFNGQRKFVERRDGKFDYYFVDVVIANIRMPSGFSELFKSYLEGGIVVKELR